MALLQYLWATNSPWASQPYSVEIIGKENLDRDRGVWRFLKRWFLKRASVTKVWLPHIPLPNTDSGGSHSPPCTASGNWKLWQSGEMTLPGRWSRARWVPQRRAWSFAGWWSLRFPTHGSLMCRKSWHSSLWYYQVLWQITQQILNHWGENRAEEVSPIPVKTCLMVFGKISRHLWEEKGWKNTFWCDSTHREKIPVVDFKSQP